MELVGRGEAHRDVVLPALGCGEVALTDCLMEQGEDGVTVVKGAQKGGDCPDPVLHDPAILHDVGLGQ